MTRGRPKNLENMTQEERVQYWDNRERQAEEMLTPAQRQAIDTAQQALACFCTEWAEDFDLTSNTVRKLNNAMKTIHKRFDLHRGTF